MPISLFEPKNVIEKEFGEFKIYFADCSFNYETFMQINSNFKFYFSTREDCEYIGIDHITNTDFQKVFELLPDSTFFFFQESFYKDKKNLILPKIQIFGKDGKYRFQYIAHKNDTSDYKLELLPWSKRRNIFLNENHVPSENEWKKYFLKAQGNLTHDRKIVLSRKSLFYFKYNIQVDQLFEKISKKSFYNFLIQNENHYFIGSSPERLIQFKNNEFLTEALAGTTPIDKKNELIHSSKNQREHNFVVQSILESLKPYCSSVKIEPQVLFEYKNLVHLKTPIRATPITTNIFNWIQALHPTPAISGWPKDFAYEFLSKNEPYKRENYCSALGIIHKNHMDICVALRCAEIYQNLITVYSGVGVVSESQPQDEWDELDLKIAPFKDALNI